MKVAWQDARNRDVFLRREISFDLYASRIQIVVTPQHMLPHQEQVRCSVLQEMAAFPRFHASDGKRGRFIDKEEIGGGGREREQKRRCGPEGQHGSLVGQYQRAQEVLEGGRVTEEEQCRSGEEEVKEGRRDAAHGRHCHGVLAGLGLRRRGGLLRLLEVVGLGHDHSRAARREVVRRAELRHLRLLC